MTNDQFFAATERVRRERGLSVAELADALGITSSHMSRLRRVGGAKRDAEREPNRTIIMALRALSAGSPPMPEEL